MKKIFIALLFMLSLSFSVLAATDCSINRAISNNAITLTIDPGSHDIFTIEETISGASFVANSWGNKDCGLSSLGKVLTCEFDGTTTEVIFYQTTGTGTIRGEMSCVGSEDIGGLSGTVSVTGDSSVPKTMPKPPCTAREATACVSGVACPTNLIIPAIGCPPGQSCSTAGVCATNAQTIGQKIDAELTEAEKTTRPTTNVLQFISKIAGILRDWLAGR